MHLEYPRITHRRRQSPEEQRTLLNSTRFLERRLVLDSLDLRTLLLHFWLSRFVPQLLHLLVIDAHVVFRPGFRQEWPRSHQRNCEAVTQKVLK